MSTTDSIKTRYKLFVDFAASTVSMTLNLA